MSDSKVSAKFWACISRFLTSAVVVGQVKGDGEPTCFTNAEDTGVPALQEWCHKLTFTSRARVARNFMTQFKAFLTSIGSYVQGIGEVTAVDRESLRAKWESGAQSDDEDDVYGHALMDSDYSSDLDGILGGGGLYSLKRSTQKVDAYGQPVGITPRLKTVRADDYVCCGLY